MSSPSNPVASLLSGRAKWLWLAVAGALGLWLIVLLALSGPDREQKGSSAGAGKVKSFDTPAAEAFSKRKPVKSSRPSVAFPIAPDQGQSQ